MLGEEFGHHALLLHDVLRLAQRDLHAGYEIGRDGLDRCDGDVLDLRDELVGEAIGVIETGEDDLSVDLQLTLST